MPIILKDFKSTALLVFSSKPHSGNSVRYISQTLHDIEALSSREDLLESDCGAHVHIVSSLSPFR